MAKHPMQPVVVDDQGTHRFKANSIVRWLLDHGPFDLNDIARGDFPEEDYAQLMMLIGYSVSGCPRLPGEVRAAARLRSAALARGEEAPCLEELAEARETALEEVRVRVEEILEDLP